MSTPTNKLLYTINNRESRMYKVNPIVICTECGKLGSTRNERAFTGFLKCNCKECSKQFLYLLSGLYLVIYTALSINITATVLFFLYDYFNGESKIGFLLFAMPAPLLILFFSASMLVKNMKINNAIKATKNA